MLARTRAAAGTIVSHDGPPPELPRLPTVLVAGTCESGERFAVTRELAVNVEDSAPTMRRREPGR